jgi:hypothetical protein
VLGDRTTPVLGDCTTPVLRVRSACSALETLCLAEKHVARSLAERHVARALAEKHVARALTEKHVARVGPDKSDHRPRRGPTTVRGSSSVIYDILGTTPFEGTNVGHQVQRRTLTRKDRHAVRNARRPHALKRCSGHSARTSSHALRSWSGPGGAASGANGCSPRFRSNHERLFVVKGNSEQMFAHGRLLRYARQTHVRQHG